MKRTLIAKLLLAASLALPWLAASTGCSVSYHRDRDDRGWHRGWDDHRGYRYYYDPDYYRHERHEDHD